MNESSQRPHIFKGDGYSGGMVLYVDDFAAQGTESPRVVMKIADMGEVDERVLSGLEEERINRHSVVLRGGKPYDPARRQMEILATQNVYRTDYW